MPAKIFETREELLKLAKEHTWGWGIGQIRWVIIYWDESIVGDWKVESSNTSSPISHKIIYLRTPEQLEIFLNRNLMKKIVGQIYIHNALGSYLGF